MATTTTFPTFSASYTDLTTRVLATESTLSASPSAFYPLVGAASLIAGGALILTILALYLSGLTCRCCRAFDVFSGELWVVREFEEALAAPPPGFEGDERYQYGARAKGFQAAKRGTQFGGALFWASVAAGLALRAARARAS